MTVRLGINGFGRIGRLVFRSSLLKPSIQVLSINDPFLDVDYLLYQLNYDSVHGHLKNEIKDVKIQKLSDNSFSINGREVFLTREKEILKIDWGKRGVDIVCESSGVFLKREQCEHHLKAGNQTILLNFFPLTKNDFKFNPKELNKS